MAQYSQLDRVEESLGAHKETRSTEFKQSFDPTQTRDWCELLKDVMAIANSGGGVIVFGVDNDGVPTGREMDSIAALDPATITDKLQAYTGIHFEEFRLVREIKNGKLVVCLELFELETPVIPTKPGTYPSIDGKKQERSFSVGVVYVRHGAKSEPANTWDLRKLIDKRISAARKDVLHGVRQIAKAPKGAKIDVLVSKRNVATKGGTKSRKLNGLNQIPAVRTTSAMSANPVRLTSNPDAPAFHLVKPDETYPLRMKELVTRVNKEIASFNQKISPHVIHEINRVYGTFTNVEHCYESQYGPRQYSEDFAQWIVQQVRKRPSFLYLTHSKARRMRR